MASGPPPSPDAGVTPAPKRLVCHPRPPPFPAWALCLAPVAPKACDPGVCNHPFLCVTRSPQPQPQPQPSHYPSLHNKAPSPQDPAAGEHGGGKAQSLARYKAALKRKAAHIQSTEKALVSGPNLSQLFAGPVCTFISIHMGPDLTRHFAWVCTSIYMRVHGRAHPGGARIRQDVRVACVDTYDPPLNRSLTAARQPSRTTTTTITHRSPLSKTMRRSPFSKGCGPPTVGKKPKGKSSQG